MSEPRNGADELVTLFTALFNADELRRWVAMNLQEDIVLHLPGVASSLRSLAQELVAVLMRRGEINEGLFLALTNDFPYRAKDIEAVRSIYIGDRRPPTLPTTRIDEDGWLDTSTNSHGIVAQLLARLFTPSELTIFVEHLDHGHQLIQSIYFGPTTTPIEYADAVTRGLHHRGMINENLFHALSSARPGRSKLINRIHTILFDSSTSPPPKNTAQPKGLLRRSANAVLRRLRQLISFKRRPVEFQALEVLSAQNRANALRALTSLVKTTFTEGELLRLIQHRVDPTLQHDLPSTVDQSEEAHQLIVELLYRRGRIDQNLYHALATERPKLAAEIKRVRDVHFVKVSTTSLVISGRWPFFARMADFFVRFTATLRRFFTPGNGVDRIDPDAQQEAFRQRVLARRAAQVDPELETRGWLEAAAVLDAFTPSSLRPVGAAHGTALAVLASWVVELPDGRWVMQERWRQPALERLLREGRVAEAQAANPTQIGRLAAFFGELAAGRIPPYASLDLDGLTDLSEALRRIDGQVPLPSQLATGVITYIERRRTIEPLRRLAGTHFRGRDSELQRLRDHINSEAAPDTMMVWGPGGIGKSALIGALLLERENAPAGVPDPFIYLDFDHASLDPLQPLRLIEVAAGQLALLYATHPGAIAAFRGVESGAAGDTFGFSVPIGSSLEEAAQALAAALHKVRDARSPLLVVLDTFERVHLRGDQAVAQTRRFVDTLKRAWPRTRVIISGRTRAHSWSQHVEDGHLASLDASDARDVLHALGVQDRLLASKLVERLGSAPLTLRLAADVVLRAGVSALDGIDAHDRLLGEAHDALVQQVLYTRILGHLGDREVQALAHPGLVVRRLSPAILAGVLAGPCHFDPADAEDIFRRLARQITLLERDADGSLRHRSDIRALMLRAMVADRERQETMHDIHRRAEQFYRGRPGLVDRAELLYHSLWLERPAKTLDALWDPSLSPLLAPAWDEPLPEEARAWLAPRIGQGDDPALDLQSWEFRATREARLHLATDDPAGALVVLRERPERRPEAGISELEVEALLRLARLSEAAELLVPAREHASGPVLVRLELLNALLAEARSDESGLRRACDSASAEAQALGDEASELQALVILVRGAPAGRTAAARVRLTTRFVDANPEILRKHPRLAAEVMRLAGPHAAEVLQKGARIFGRTLDERGFFRFDAFKVESLLERVASDVDAAAAMSRLAVQVGLPRVGFTMHDLADNAIRTGKIGDAIGIALEHGGHDSEIRQEVLDLIQRNLPSNDRLDESPRSYEPLPPRVRGSGDQAPDPT